jgi:hypothetical protein
MGDFINLSNIGILSNQTDNRGRVDHFNVDNSSSNEWEQERGYRGGSRGGNGKHSKHGKGRCDD